MKRTFSTFKTYFLSTLVGSAVLAGTYADLKLKSNAFMFENKIDIVSFSPEQTTRIVASRVHDYNLPAVSYLGVNAENKKKINGRWEVTRVLDTKGNAIYDTFKNKKDRRSIVVVDMKMISTSTVVLDEDKNQIFKISLLTERNTIALFKVVNGGYEILEAKKIIAAPKYKRPTLASAPKFVEPKVKKETKKGIRINDMDLMLESALNPLQSRNILNITQVNGSLSVFDGSIQDFRASLNSGSNKEVNLDFSFAEIKDGGQFETDISGQVATGIISNNGESSYKIRFATGPLQGAILTFVSREKYEQTQEKFANYEEAPKQPAPAQNARAVRPINTERLEGEPGIERVPAEEVEYEDEVVLFKSNEQKLEHVKNYGFSFGKSERKPASIK